MDLIGGAPITVAPLCKKWSTLPHRLMWLSLFQVPKF